MPTATITVTITTVTIITTVSTTGTTAPTSTTTASTTTPPIVTIATLFSYSGERGGMVGGLVAAREWWQGEGKTWHISGCPGEPHQSVPGWEGAPQVRIKFILVRWRNWQLNQCTDVLLQIDRQTRPVTKRERNVAGLWTRQPQF